LLARRGISVDTPRANVDFAPTFLRLLDLPVPPTIQGRVLEEALITGTPVNGARQLEHTARTPDGSYAVTATFSIVNAGGRDYRYLVGTKVERK
jgi:arylsulfatase A-like enzyme